MLEWFGIAPSGRMVPAWPAGRTVPGYEIVDWAKLRNAILDPWGYRRLVKPPTSLLWSEVKELYR